MGYGSFAVVAVVVAVVLVVVVSSGREEVVRLGWEEAFSGCYGSESGRWGLVVISRSQMVRMGLDDCCVVLCLEVDGFTRRYGAEREAWTHLPMALIWLLGCGAGCFYKT